jgi:hypothetical protein
MEGVSKAGSESDLEPPPYSSWMQVAGYFDGDGNVGMEVVKRIIKFKIRFVDTWRPQIESIVHFLAGQGVHFGRIGKGDKRGDWQAAYRLDIVEVKSVIMAAKAMLRYTVKKRRELLVVIDYLEGRVIGNEAIGVFNEETRSGRRHGKVRVADLPYTRDDGLRMAQLENARNARAAYAVNVSGAIQEEIRKDHRELKLGHVRLSKKYGYSVSVIRRILGAQ